MRPARALVMMCKCLSIGAAAKITSAGNLKRLIKVAKPLQNSTPYPYLAARNACEWFQPRSAILRLHNHPFVIRRRCVSYTRAEKTVEPLL